MNDKQKLNMDEKDLTLQTDSAPMDKKEVSEQPSELDDSFLAEPVAAPEVVEELKPLRDDTPMAVQEDARIGTDFWNHDDDWEATVIGESPNKKELQVAKRKEGSGYVLQWRSGGDLPALYSGWYTSFDKARSAGFVYLNELRDAAAKKS